MRFKSVKLTALLLIVLSMLMAACSSGWNNGNAGESGEESVTHLTMWVRTWDNLPFIEEAVKSFNAANPDIEVEVVSFSPDQYGPATQAAVSGGELPDLFQPMSLLNMYQLKEQGMIQPLPISQEFMDRFEEGTWWEGTTTIDGVPYAYPDSSYRDARLILFYNKDLMRSAGLDPESPPTTWEELYEQSKAIAASNPGIYGLVEPMKADWFLTVLTQMLGTTVDHQSTYITNQERFYFNWKEGTTFSSEAIMESAQYVKSFIDEGLMLPDYLLMDPPAAAAQFGEGNAAFTMNGYWFLRTFLNDYPDMDFGVAALPAKEFEPALGAWGGSPAPFLLNSETENTEAVTKLLEHLTNEYYPLLVESQQNLSPIAEINNDPALEVSEQFKDYIEIVNNMVKLHPSPVIRDRAEADVMTHINSQPLRETLGDMLQEYMSVDDYDLQAAFDRFEANSVQQFDEAINAIEGASKDHWIFPNFTMMEDYGNEKYEELK